MPPTMPPIDLLEEALIAAGESAPDTLEALLALPKIKVFSGALKAYEGPNGQKSFRCTASSTIEDLHGDTMTEECVRDMARQAKAGPTGKGLTIFLNHRYSVPEDVAGKVLDAGVLTRANDAETGLPIWDMDYEVGLVTNSARVDQTWNLIANDEITLGISIGAYILEYDFKDKEEGFWGGLIIRRVLLVETSIVGIPANQRSWVQNSVIAIGKSLGIEEKTIRRVLDGKEARPMKLKTAAADGIVKTPIEVPLGEIATLTVTGADQDLGRTPDPVVTAEAQLDPIEIAERLMNGVPATELITSVTDDAPTPTETKAEEADEAESAEASEAAPDGESSAEETPEAPTEQASGEEPVKADLAALVPEVALSLEAGVTPATEILLLALEKAAGQVAELRREAADLQARITAAEAERDKAKQDMKDAAELIETVARTPLGRRAQFVAPIESFRTRFAGMYDDAFLEFLDKHSKE